MARAQGRGDKGTRFLGVSSGQAHILGLTQSFYARGDCAPYGTFGNVWTCVWWAHWREVLVAAVGRSLAGC